MTEAGHERAAGLITVMETGSEAALVVAKSLLDDAGIPYATRGERIVGLDLTSGPVQIQVPAPLAEEARARLAALQDAGGGRGPRSRARRHLALVPPAAG